MTITDQRTKLFQHDAGKAPYARNYRGLHDYAKTGLHARIAEIVRDNVVPGAPVLDLACGQGALALRLQDAGFKVSASDYVAGNFRPTGIPFIQVDCNGTFAAKLGSYDCIVASEIIEHLENPRHFLRELKKCLTPGGTLIITTPNPDSAVSKAMYLAFGHFTWFDDFNYQTIGHITPVSPRLLEQCAKETGFTASIDTWSSPWDTVRHRPRMKLYSALVSLLARSPFDGDILIGVLRVP